jgi:inner membrane protein
MLWWVWILLGFLLLLIELMTPGGLYLLFFGIAAVLVGLLAGLELSGPNWMEWLLFSIVSIIALALFRRPLLQKLRPSMQGKEIDSLVGETVMTMEDIAVNGIGKAELRGSSWNVRNAGSAPLTRGQRCTVERVEGLLLWVRE